MIHVDDPSGILEYELEVIGAETLEIPDGGLELVSHVVLLETKPGGRGKETKIGRDFDMEKEDKKSVLVDKLHRLIMHLLPLV